MNERPAFLNKCQPKTTYSGSQVKEVPWTLPYWTESLCPECQAVIKARKFIDGEEVFMEKECVEHGYFKEIISPDANFYMRLFTTRHGDGRGITNPEVTTGRFCPEDCGICNMHHSGTCMATIDLTSQHDTTHEQVVEILKALRNQKPVPTKAVQFSGWDLDIFRKAKDLGFSKILMAHDGKNTVDIDFARSAAGSGLHIICLQDIPEAKLIKACREASLKIILTPVITKGVNNDQVGAIVKFACENADVIMAVIFQPVCFTEKISEKDRLNKRYTITHLAKDVAAQTDNLMPLEKWLPLSSFASCHPDCGAGGYLQTVFIGAMHFQDLYNYDIQRLKRCAIHHAAPNGKLYPLCALRYKRRPL